MNAQDNKIKSDPFSHSRRITRRVSAPAGISDNTVALISQRSLPSITRQSIDEWAVLQDHNLDTILRVVSFILHTKSLMILTKCRVKDLIQRRIQ